MGNIIKWCNDNQGFLSAVLSIVAVLAAIGIPAFIAHRQNKIALFAKRFTSYSEFKLCFLLSEHIANYDHPAQVVNSYNVVFNRKIPASDYTVTGYEAALRSYLETEVLLNQATFLFPFVEGQDIIRFSDSLRFLCMKMVREGSMKSAVNQYIDTSIAFERKYLKEIESYLSI